MNGKNVKKISPAEISMTKEMRTLNIDAPQTKKFRDNEIKTARYNL
jgi:hypothetical protein